MCDCFVFVASTAQAGRARQEYVDGCQSVDGRYVVTAQLVGANPKDPKAGKWTFRWTDTKNMAEAIPAKRIYFMTTPIGHWLIFNDSERPDLM